MKNTLSIFALTFAAALCFGASALLAGDGAMSDPTGSPLVEWIFSQIPEEPLFGDNLCDADAPEGVWSMASDGEFGANEDKAIWTSEKIGSFDCTFEFKMSPHANAGFLFSCTDKDNWIPNTIEIQLLEDYGCQPDYHSCASFYGYQGPTKNASKKANQWNKMRIQRVGCWVKVWLNDELVNTINTAAWTDREKSPAGTDIEEKFHGHSLASAEPYGFIGLQGLHHGEPVRYRNAVIKKVKNFAPDTAKSGWGLLFGEDLSNADCDKNVWSIKDGMLISNKDDAIWSKDKYENFVLDFDFVCAPTANSGIVIKASDKANWIPNALEVQIEDTADKPCSFTSCGAIYGKTPVLYNSMNKADQWNHMSIACQGDWIFVILNGELVTLMDKGLYTDKVINADGSETKPWLRERAPADLENNGFIGIQGLHNGEAPAYYKNVKILGL